MPEPDRQLIITALQETAADWQDPEYGPRQVAVEETLRAENRFTEEAVAFAVNQQMAEMLRTDLAEWASRYPFAKERKTIGVLNPGNIPFVEVPDLVAVLVSGHRYLGSVSSRSPALLPAFIQDMRGRNQTIAADIGPLVRILERCDAVIASGSSETMEEIAGLIDDAGIPPERRLLRGTRFAIAVLDGREDDEERSGLAEDVVLHEGAGCRSVAMIWAPASLEPDPYLDAFEQFREVFPAHDLTDGSLALPRALLAAAEQPHAYGSGFLVSKGAPEFQSPAHIRWVVYESLSQVNEWIASHRDELQGVLSSSRLADKIAFPVWPFGEAQRPPLDWCPDGIDTLRFAATL